MCACAVLVLARLHLTPLLPSWSLIQPLPTYLHAHPHPPTLAAQLTTLSKRLRAAIGMIDPGRKARLRELRRRVSTDVISSIDAEHDQIRNRKRQIEKLKEEQEAARVKAARDAQTRAAKEAEERKKAEEARKETERLAREKAEAEANFKLEKLREKKAIIESIRITEQGRQVRAALAGTLHCPPPPPHTHTSHPSHFLRARLVFNAHARALARFPHARTHARTRPPSHPYVCVRTLRSFADTRLCIHASTDRSIPASPTTSLALSLTHTRDRSLWPSTH
jgi:hypothetical protein